MNTRETLFIKDKRLMIGGAYATDLAEKYGTPLYVMDVSYVEAIIDVFTKTIKDVYGEGRMLYASKALSTKAMYSLVKKTEAGCDVVSGGELYTALSAGFPADKIYMHGNNKLPSEIEYALKSGVHALVIDSFDEIELVSDIAERLGVVAPCMLRLNPGISAHTHEFVQTACDDSKFGIAIKTGEAFSAIEKILADKNLEMLGVHVHIGSQIFERTSYELAAKAMTTFLAEVKSKLNVEFPELNMGGGFGIYYEGDDKKFSLSDYADHLSALLKAVKAGAEENGLKLPYIVVEPGRSIVGEAGITLYTVGTIKDVKGIRKYVAIDGGMFDNPRYALYGSRYSAVVCDRADEPASELITLAGKCCESGDLIAKDIYIQPVKKGDVVAVFSTGAYNYSMASNYNRNFIPPMVAVKDGKSDYMVLPQTYEDLVRNDVIPEMMK